MQRILILSDDSFSLWQFRRELISTMVASHIEVIIGAPNGERTAELQELGCKLIDTTPNAKLGTYRQGHNLLQQCLQIMKAEKPDVVVTYGPRSNVCGGMACRRAKCPHCANIQSLAALSGKTVKAFFRRLLYRAALKRSKVVFFENATGAAFFQENKLIKKSQQMILPGAGVNLRHYTLQPYPENDTVRFLYLGRMQKEKGMDELLAAIKMLYDDCYEVRLDLVGQQDEAYAEQLAELKDMGIVAVHGFQEDPRPFYAAADCVVMPSHAEGMNNVLLEASASGRPIIASYIPGCREIVDEAHTGFTYRTQDKYALLDAMKRMAEMSREQRKEMGLQGRARMEELFDKQTVVEDTMNAIFRP